MSNTKAVDSAAPEDMNWELLTAEVIEAATITASSVARTYGIDADDLAQDAYIWTAHNHRAKDALAESLHLYQYLLHKVLKNYAKAIKNNTHASLDQIQEKHYED